MKSNKSHGVLVYIMIWSGIHTIFALSRKETVGILVHFRLHVHQRITQSLRITLDRCILCDLVIKDTTEDNTSAFYMDLLLSSGKVSFTFPFMTKVTISISISQNFRFFKSSPSYGVLISQLVRNAKACSSYGCFILRATRLSNKLLEQGYTHVRQGTFDIVIEEVIWAIGNNMKFPSHEC